MHNSKVGNRTITVEYQAESRSSRRRDDRFDDRRRRRSRSRSRDRRSRSRSRHRYRRSRSRSRSRSRDRSPRYDRYRSDDRRR